jgi:hypothetical protein
MDNLKKDGVNNVLVSLESNLVDSVGETVELFHQPFILLLKLLGLRRTAKVTTIGPEKQSKKKP